MNFKKIAAILIVIIAGLGFLISQGYYPVAVVNSDLISARSVKWNGDLALNSVAGWARTNSLPFVNAR